MTAEEKSISASGDGGVVQVGDRLLPLGMQAPADVVRVHREMVRQAKAKCLSPIEFVNSHAGKISPAAFAEAMRQAVAMGCGGGAEPTREALMEQYDTREGVSYQLWFYARKADPSLSLEFVKSLVTDENVYDVADALGTALGSLEKKRSASGTSG